MIVLSQPYSDDDLGLFDCAEPLCIEHFSAQCAIEAFVVTVFPGTTWIDADRFDANFPEPALEVCGNELRPIV